MKKLILFLILSFLWRVGGFAQGDFTRIYHPIINEAELAIVDTNYYDALDYYKEAFANVKKPFAKDYYNAAICASMIGKLPLTFEYLEKIVEKGYPSDSLRKDVFFHYVADTCKRWPEFEKQMRLVKPNINWELRDSLNKLYALSMKNFRTPLTEELRDYFRKNVKAKEIIISKKDTIIRETNVGDSLYFFGNLPQNLKIQQDSLRKMNDKKYTDALNLVSQNLSKLIDNYNFPDENMIGLSGYEYKVISPRFGRFSIASQSFNDLMFNKSLMISLLENPSFSNNKDFLSNMIQAIRDGKLAPQQISNVAFSRFNNITKSFETFPIAYTMGKVQVLQLQLDSNLNCAKAEGIQNKKFWKKEKLTDYSEAEINNKRQDIGLEKLADAYKKAFFKAYPTPFMINGGTYQKELSYISSCDVLEKMLKESVIIR
ncbi:hypothetical protein [Emticicia sp. SJ17W-69]|uniref:hypothetical protein n=1 Tax=Emticicia sp. SJ17W-69 TaxID=3421657 RepID=UPI003EBE28D7